MMCVVIGAPLQSEFHDEPLLKRGYELFLLTWFYFANHSMRSLLNLRSAAGTFAPSC